MHCPACNIKNKNPDKFNYSPATIDKLALFDSSEILCCENCGFGMIEKDVEEQILQNYYSSEYSGKARKQAEIRPIDTRTGYSVDFRSLSQLTLIKQFFSFPSDSTVLEIGAGAGGFLFMLKQMNFKGRYIAFEPQEQAHEYLFDLGAEIEKKPFDVESSKKYKNSVDLVIMSHSLEHFNPRKISETLSGIQSMLNKGGCFFCEVPNANLSLYQNAGERVVPHLSFFSINALKCFIKKAELKLIFLNACGNSQLEKNQEQRIIEGNRVGSYLFDLDEENGVLRNRKYHQFIQTNKLKERRRQKIISLFITFLGKNITLYLFDFIRRIKQQPHYSLVNSNYFLYEKDREFLRMIALK